MTPAERFLAAERDTDRTACARYLRAQGVDDDNALAVEAAKAAYRAQPILLDPEVASLSRAALIAARGPAVTGTTPFPVTIYFGGATDTHRGVRFTSDFDHFVKHVLVNRSTDVAEKRQGWVVTPVTSKTGERKNADTVSVNALNLDCDNRGTWDAIRAELDSLGLAYMLYQSGGWTPAQPKWHLMLPLARPFMISGLPENWLKWRAAYATARTALGALGRLLGEGFDPTVDAPSVPVFITERRRLEDPPRQVVSRHGASLDIHALCAALPVRPEEDRRACERAISEAAPLPGGKLDEIIVALCKPMSVILEGRRELYLALTGALLDRGVPPDDAYAIIEEVSRRCPGDPRYTPVEVDQKHREHLHGADTTIAKYEAGETYTRIGTLGGRWPTVARAVDLALPDPQLQEIEAMIARYVAEESKPGGVPPLPGGVPPLPTGVPLLPGSAVRTDAPAPISLDAVRKSLLAVRARKKRNMSGNLDEIIRYSIIDALIRGEDLVPRDGKSGAIVADSRGKLVDRDRAVGVAMGMLAHGLPVNTPFTAVRVLALHSLAATAGAEVPLADLVRVAESAFTRAVGKRVERDVKNFAASYAERLSLE